MIAVYLDETGNTGKRIDDPTQSIHRLGALIVAEHAWLSVRQALERIVAPYGVPAPELHGTQLFHGGGPWRQVPESNRVSVYHACTEVVLDPRYALQVVVGAADKHKLQRYSTPMDPRDIAFWLTLEQVAESTRSTSELVFMVADDGPPAARQVIRNQLRTYRASGPPFGRAVDVSRIIDTVHFMDSADSLHLQLCDLVLFAVHRGRSDNGAFGETFHRLRTAVGSSRLFPY